MTRQGSAMQRQGLQQQLNQIKDEQDKKEKEIREKYSAQLHAVQRTFAKHLEALEDQATAVLNEYESRRSEQEKMRQAYDEKKLIYDKHIRWCVEKAKLQASTT